MSNGEKRTLLYLDSRSIPYKLECRFRGVTPFDFIIYYKERLVAIEYQGEQHYRSVKFEKNKKPTNFKKRQTLDSKKREFCKKHNIPLIEIPYWANHLETFLTQKLLEIG